MLLGSGPLWGGWVGEAGVRPRTGRWVSCGVRLAPGSGLQALWVASCCGRCLWAYHPEGARSRKLSMFRPGWYLDGRTTGISGAVCFFFVPKCFSWPSSFFSPFSVPPSPVAATCRPPRHRFFPWFGNWLYFQGLARGSRPWILESIVPQRGCPSLGWRPAPASCPRHPSPRSLLSPPSSHSPVAPMPCGPYAPLRVHGRGPHPGTPFPASGSRALSNTAPPCQQPPKAG